MQFDRSEADKYWVRQSVLNYIDLFIDNDVIPVFKTELDLFEDMYGFVKSSRRLSQTTAEI